MTTNISNITEALSSEEAKKLIRASKAKVVVLEFVASWCGICRLVKPQIAISSQYKSNYEFHVTFPKFDFS